MLNLKEAKAQTRTVIVDMSQLYGEDAGFELDVLAMPSRAIFQPLQDDPHNTEALREFLRAMVVEVRGLDDFDGNPVGDIDALLALPMPFQAAAANAVTEMMEASALSPKLSMK